MVLRDGAHVAIIGGGFSGTLLAINLLRHEGPRVTLIERHADQLARGVAYGAAAPDHLLNVRAAGMSAFPDDPGHFERWLGARAADASPFVRRRLYGLYLREMLAKASAGREARFQVANGDVTNIVNADAGMRLVMGDGTSVDVDAAVLGLGSIPPSIPHGLGLEALNAGEFVDDPWRLEPGRGEGAVRRILLIGTGLTAIDVLLDLDRRGLGGEVVALSRRGLVPRAHDPAQLAVAATALPRERLLSSITRTVRLRARAIGWRGAIDELRPITHQLWWRADEATRARFLRHLRPYWDVHRHRLAPEAMARVEELEQGGQFRALAGKLSGVERADGGLVIRWRQRGTDAEQHLEVDRIINCTGVHGDLTRSGEPLLRNLTQSGAIRPDRFRLGIDTDSECRVIGADGDANPRLYCIGPMTRGAFWEMTAVPDLRRQAWLVARRLANAHWDGIEGL